VIAAPGYEGGLSGTPGELMSAGLAVRDKVLASLKIVDWGLFVHEGSRTSLIHQIRLPRSDHAVKSLVELLNYR
jgi:hypothetical protein